MPKPKSIPKDEVCSECGLSWSRHPEDATKADCIRLLKIDLQNAEIRAAQKPNLWTYWPNTHYPEVSMPWSTKPVRWQITEGGAWKAEKHTEKTSLPFRITKEWGC